MFQQLLVSRRESIVCGEKNASFELVRKGFHELWSPPLLSLFTAKELQESLEGQQEVSVDDWHAHSDTEDVGNSLVEWWWSTLREMSEKDRVAVYQWASGSSRLPCGGFKALGRRFVVRGDFRGPESCPSVSTCAFTVFLPRYESREQLKSKLYRAISEVGFWTA